MCEIMYAHANAALDCWRTPKYGTWSGEFVQSDQFLSVRFSAMDWPNNKFNKSEKFVWGAGITNMIAKTMKGVAQG